MNNKLNLNTRRAMLIFLCITSCISLIYITSKLFVTPGQEAFGLDFRVFWLAGKMWLGGQDPYASQFADKYIEEFSENGMNMGGFFYPLYWYPFATFFALFPFNFSHTLWNIINISFIVVATYLIAKSIDTYSDSRRIFLFLIGVSFVLSMQATAITIFIGQTSAFIYLGFALAIYALISGRPFMLIAGLFFLALKPHIGLVAFSSVLGLSRYRWTVIAAGFLCLLATLPILLWGDYLISLKEFLRNFGSPYQTIAANHPSNLTGSINLVYAAFTTAGNTWLNISLVICSSLAGFGIFYISELDDPAVNIEKKLVSLMLFLASTLFLLPLHPYDQISVAAIFMIASVISSTGRWIVICGAILCFHPREIALALGISNPASTAFPESLFESLALFMIVIGAVWVALETRIARPSNLAPSFQQQ